MSSPNNHDTTSPDMSTPNAALPATTTSTTASLPTSASVSPSSSTQSSPPTSPDTFSTSSLDGHTPSTAVLHSPLLCPFFRPSVCCKLCWRLSPTTIALFQGLYTVEPGPIDLVDLLKTTAWALVCQTKHTYEAALEYEEPEYVVEQAFDSYTEAVEDHHELGRVWQALALSTEYQLMAWGYDLGDAWEGPPVIREFY